MDLNTFPDEATLGLWHFDGGDLTDTSDNAVKGEVEGKAVWDDNQKWNKENKPGKSFVFDGNTAISLGEAKVLIPKVEITLEAWVYPEDLSGWRLIFTNWDGPPGAYHLGVQNGIAKFHINTEKGVAFAGAAKPLELEEWQHVAGTSTIPTKLNSILTEKRSAQQTTVVNYRVLDSM